MQAVPLGSSQKNIYSIGKDALTFSVKPQIMFFLEFNRPLGQYELQSLRTPTVVAKIHVLKQTM